MTPCLSKKKTAAHRKMIKTAGLTEVVQFKKGLSLLHQQLKVSKCQYPRPAFSHGPGGQALFIHACYCFGCTVDHLPTRHASESHMPISPADIE